MPDIQLRFQKDMLVLSAPLDAALARQGIDAARDRQYLNLMEPEAIEDALKLEAAAGAQCLVTATEDITRARLAHLRMDSDAPKLAAAALRAASVAKPQHLLAEIGPCGLPLDASSKTSLKENRDQYADAARALEAAPDGFDALFLNGFTSIPDMKCALMGVAMASDKPVFASMTVAEGGQLTEAPEGSGSRQARDARGARATRAADELPDFPFDGYAALDDLASPPVPASLRGALDPAEWPEAIAAMADLGAAVIGFETPDPVERALGYARAAVEGAGLPVLAQLRVVDAPADPLVPLAEVAEYTPDTLSSAAVKLYAAGAQFLRATGEATAASTGALAATVAGLDVRPRQS